MASLGRPPSSAPLNSADIPDNSITASKIVDGAVGVADIADDSITGAKIENNPTISGNLTVAGDLIPSSQLSHRNMIINGDMRINQRGSGSLTINSGTVQYPCDRFSARGVSSAGVFTLESVTDSPAGFTNSLKATVTTDDSSLSGTESYRVMQHIEGNNISHLNWGSSDNQAVALSFKVKSSLAGTFGGVVQNGDYNRFVPFTYTIDSANTWEDKTVTIAGDTSGTYPTDESLAVRLNWSLGAAELGTAGTYTATTKNGATGQTQVISTLNATWQVTGVQLELGSNATPFEHRSYGDELAKCQRYFWSVGGVPSPEGSSNYYEHVCVAYMQSTTAAYGVVPHPVFMRAPPTVAILNPTGFYFNNNEANTALSGGGVINNGKYNTAISFTTSATRNTQTSGRVLALGSAASIIQFSSEL